MATLKRPADSNPSPGAKKTRTFKCKSTTGCLTCKNRKVKCDETDPICNNCRRLGRVCIQRNGSSTGSRARGNVSDATGTPISSTPSAAPSVAEGPIIVIGSQTANTHEGTQDGEDTVFTSNASELVLELEAPNTNEGSNTFSQRPMSTTSFANTFDNFPERETLVGTFADYLDVAKEREEISYLMGPWPYLEPIMGKTSNSTPESASSLDNAMISDKDNTARVASSASQLSPMTTNKKSTIPSTQSTTKDSKELEDPTARFTNTSLNDSSSISTPSPMDMSNSSTPASSALPTPNSSNSQFASSTDTTTQSTPGALTVTQALSDAAQIAPRQATSGSLEAPSTTPLAMPGTNQPKYTSTLSLASTTTNAPTNPNSTPLRPIHHWVLPRPVILRRTSPPPAEKAATRAEHAARQAEKKAEAEETEKEMQILRQGAKKAKELEMEERAKALQERMRE